MDLHLLGDKALEEGQRVIITVDPGRPGTDMTAIVTARLAGDGEIFIVSLDNISTKHPPAGTLALAVNKQADDTVKAPRSGGPPPHTLKNYSRKRSNR